MAAEVLRKILTRNVQSKTLASAVSSTLCPNVREFSSVSGFTGVFEAQSRRWRAPPLQSVLDFSNTTNLPRPSQISRALLLTHTPQRSLHLSLSQYSSSAEPKGEKAGEKKQGQDSIVYSEEEAGDLSDKVAPVSRPEAAGWSLVIVAAYGITAFLVYTVYTSIIVEGPEDKVFNQALEAVRKDFRVTSLLGTSIKGYGGAGGGRRGRQRIAHDTYTDSSNVKHTQVQFLVAGNGKRGVVSADMYMRDGEWNYSYLFVDIEGDRFVLKPVGSSFAPN